MFPSPHVCSSDRGLCGPGGVDLYGLCHKSHSPHTLYLLSSVLDDYVSGSFGLLCDGAKENGERIK